MANFKINFDIENVGPHTDLNAEFNGLHSPQLRIYANNGMGKTSISRIFRLESQFKNISLLNDKKDIGNKKLEISKNLLTFNQKTGHFRFIIQENDKEPLSLSVDLKKNNIPIIDNNTGYIFHVFNTDFVQENLRETDYSLNQENFKGYILGKDFIDLSEYEEKLNVLIKEKNIIEEKINKEINDSKIELQDLDIKTYTSEFKNINFENVINQKELESENWAVLLSSYEKIRNMPEDFKDIYLPSLSLNFKLFNNIKEILTTAYEKSFFEEDFNEKISKNFDFIEKGMSIYNDSQNHICPFCEQKLNEDSEVIISYMEYMGNSESKIIKRIEGLIKNLENFKNSYSDYLNDYFIVKEDYDKIKEFLPSLSTKKLENFAYKQNEVNEKIDFLINELNNKKEDISIVNNSFEPAINFFKDLKTNLSDVNVLNKTKIETLNKVKNNIKNEKLSLKKKLCNSKFNQILINQKDNITKYKEKETEVIKLENEIDTLKNKNKKSKKKAIAESLNHYLNFFFSEKYKFDEETFSISFNEKNLEENVGFILSEGECNILAFCYYLSLVHNIINEEEDYNKIFFILDDPISSLDFDYVYALSRAIKDIRKHFSLKRLRYIILTHDFDFMNILITDNSKWHIQDLYLTTNKIEHLNEKILLPYDNHIKDIVRAFNGDYSHLHTLPNSFRHVIETIKNFEKSNLQLIQYVQNDEILSSDGHLYKLMNDLSHGKFRNQPISPEILKQTCKTVLLFITHKYPNHLKDYNLNLK